MPREKISLKVKSEIDNYLQQLRADGLPIQSVFLFGSYAKGNIRQWSDIDLCVVSPKFKDSVSANQYLWSKRVIRDVNYAIEPIGFSPREFSDNYNSLVQEIKRTGIRV